MSTTPAARALDAPHVSSGMKRLEDNPENYLSELFPEVVSILIEVNHCDVVTRAALAPISRYFFRQNEPVLRPIREALIPEGAHWKYDEYVLDLGQ